MKFSIFYLYITSAYFGNAFITRFSKESNVAKVRRVCINHSSRLILNAKKIVKNNQDEEINNAIPVTIEDLFDINENDLDFVSIDDDEDDNIEKIVEIDNSLNTKVATDKQTKYNTIITKTLSAMQLNVKKIQWFQNRIEVIAAKIKMNETDDACPNASELEKAHRDIYALLETNDSSLVEDYEIIIASPGIEDILKTSRDFISFQGFPVIVTTSELFKKKTEFEGTLQEKNDEHVIISQKGRIVKIPVELVLRVELPKPKFEPNDFEIRKLR